MFLISRLCLPSYLLTYHKIAFTRPLAVLVFVAYSPLLCFTRKVAVGLEVERQAIEAEADKAQADALQEESNYHYFQNLTSIAEAAVARVRNEEKWQQGQGHLLPNFRTYADLYKVRGIDVEG